MHYYRPSWNKVNGSIFEEVIVKGYKKKRRKKSRGGYFDRINVTFREFSDLYIMRAKDGEQPSGPGSIWRMRTEDLIFENHRGSSMGVTFNIPRPSVIDKWDRFFDTYLKQKENYWLTNTPKQHQKFIIMIVWDSYRDDYQKIWRESECRGTIRHKPHTRIT